MRLAVDNLASNATEDDLRTLFEIFGKVAAVEIQRDRGRGLVDMPSKSAAKEAITNLEEILVEKGIEIAADKSQKVAARAGAKYLASLAGGPLAPALGVISTAVTVVDGAYSTVTGAMEAYQTYQSVQGQIGPMTDVLSEAQAQISRAKEGTELLDKEKKGTLSDAEKEKLEKLKQDARKSADDLADAQSAQALADPCLRALKCTLTPYGQKSGMQARSNKPQTEGCCPGQTGHHMPPKTYFKNCPSYDPKKALVVCAEGVDQRSGSHGRMHQRTDRAAQRRLTGGDLSFDDAIEAAVEAHSESYPWCPKSCTREQLQSSLKKCKNSKINAVNKEGGPLKPPAQDDAEF